MNLRYAVCRSHGFVLVGVAMDLAPGAFSHMRGMAAGSMWPYVLGSYVSDAIIGERWGRVKFEG
jgi:hypothetical protein